MTASNVVPARHLRAPFPWFGGKSKIASIVWQRFGDTPNYVEPFFGSGAVLLSRPHWPWKGHRIETMNDADGYVCNFWRALQAEPDAVAEWADYPVSELDLHARHLWLVNEARPQVERLRAEPDFYDVKIAGWWVWGCCQWIGSGWCHHPEWEQLPHLGTPGMGVHRPSQQRPHLGDPGRGDLLEYFRLLAARLRRVRVCCGDWSRVCGPTPTVKQGITGMFLDPPYTAEANRQNGLYAVDDTDIGHAVREWAIEWGNDKRMRIALCGYEGEHTMPDDWECVAWKANGGYGSRGNGTPGRDNSTRERLWFSPHCLRVAQARQRGLFEEET